MAMVELVLFAETLFVPTGKDLNVRLAQIMRNTDLNTTPAGPSAVKGTGLLRNESRGLGGTFSVCPISTVESADNVVPWETKLA
jgi:hypothetical protein